MIPTIGTHLIRRNEKQYLNSNSTFGHNIETNDIRIGLTILFNLLPETKHKGKIIGLN